MSSSARSGTANLVSATSGTERERGFVGILPLRSDPLLKMFSFDERKDLKKLFRMSLQRG